MSNSDLIRDHNDETMRDLAPEIAAEAKERAMATKHTPLPWKCDVDSVEMSHIMGLETSVAGVRVWTMTARACGIHFQKQANAKLIVQAVNAHEALVAALEALCAWHDHPALTGRPDGAAVPPEVPSFDETVKMVRTALKLARGEA